MLHLYEPNNLRIPTLDQLAERGVLLPVYYYHMNHKRSLNIILIAVILAIIAIGGYFIFSKNPILLPQLTNSQSNQQVPSQTTTMETAPISNATSTSLDEKIAACYPKNEGCSACQPILNNSEQRVVETERRFVNVPKDFYPKEISSYFTTVRGNATAGWVSNGGLPGEGLDAAPGCWSTYYEFDGSGEVDLKVKSIKTGAPDYFVRFIVVPLQ